MNQYIFPIIKRLADGQFHSGEVIAKHLHVSRATIWNAIQAAETLGISIFSVRGRGYKLVHAITLLDQQSIDTHLKMQQANTKMTVEVHDTLTSTNHYLMQTLNQTAHDKLCIATNLQTHGRGRRGRQWQAGLGESLTFSVLWRFQCGAASLSGLSLAVGLAIVRALHALGHTAAKLKWPNDIVVKTPTNIQKLAGILIELQGDMEGPSTAVIGIGMNLKLSQALTMKIDQPAIDLSTMTTEHINPNQLLSTLLIHLEDILMTVERDGFSALKHEWLSHHAYAQEMVKMIHPDGRITTGIVNDIAENGALIVATNTGLQHFSSGEISLRGI